MMSGRETRVALYRPPVRRLPLFVYGKLAEPEFVLHLLERTLTTAPVTLCGFRSADLDGEGFPLLVEEEGARLEGTMLLKLSPEDFQRLDAYGGVGEGLYERREARGRTQDEDELTLYVYLASEKTRRRYR